MRISKEFTQRIESSFGTAGKEWLEALPSILEAVSQKWSLKIDPPFEDMVYNFVAPATNGDGKAVVLKVGVPNPELMTEMESLQIFAGEGSVAIFERDDDLGAMLLERLRPGKAILHLDDEQATGHAIQVMGQLHGKSPSEGKFPAVADWAKGLKRLRTTFDGGTGPFHSHLVEQVEGISNELLSSMDQPTLLHGDLHHWNILSASRSPWLAIDPKGIIGEPAYEAGAWIRNPFPNLHGWSNAKQLISRRIMQFSNALGVDRDRIHGWSLFQAVLAAWWSYEESDPNWELWLEVAKLIGDTG